MKLSTLVLTLSVALFATSVLSDEFVLTTNSYSETDDLDAAVVAEFGRDAAVADWEEIKERFSGQIADFCDAVGMTDYRDSALLYRNGEAWWSGSRHYFAQRHDGQVPGGWLVHDNIDNFTLDLGSWYGMNYPILVKIAVDCDRNNDGRFTIADLILFYRDCEGTCAISDVTKFWRSCRSN